MLDVVSTNGYATLGLDILEVWTVGVLYHAWLLGVHGLNILNSVFHGLRNVEKHIGQYRARTLDL